MRTITVLRAVRAVRHDRLTLRGAQRRLAVLVFRVHLQLTEEISCSPRHERSAALLVTASLAAGGAGAAAPAAAAPPGQDETSRRAGREERASRRGRERGLARKDRVDGMGASTPSGARRPARSPHSSERRRELEPGSAATWRRCGRPTPASWRRSTRDWVPIKVDAERRPDIRERYPSLTDLAGGDPRMLPNGVLYFAAKENDKVPSRVTIGAVPPERIVRLPRRGAEFPARPREGTWR